MNNTYNKLPRKLKKKIFGKKIKRKVLKKMLSEVRIVENKYPQSADILPFSFCPKCGCEYTKIVDHNVEYPEIWYDVYCLKCGYNVGGADNSSYSHCLEDEEYRLLQKGN